MKETYYRLERKRKKKKNTRLFFLSGIAVVVCIGVIAAAAVMNSSFGDRVTGSVSSAASSETSSQTASSSAPEAVSSDSKADAASEDELVFVPNTVKKDYNFSLPVAASAAVNQSFFDDTAVIGDSRAVGFVRASGLSKVKSYAQVSCSAKTVLEKPIITAADGKSITIMQAVEAEKNKYKRVYIMLGTNEIGYQSYAVAMDEYAKIIDGIRASQENVDIYLQAVLPITKKCNQTHSYLRKEKIASFNQQMQQLAQKMQVYYIDPSEALVGSDGFLPEDAAAKDGYHLTGVAYQKQLNYLKTHTVQ